MYGRSLRKIQNWESSLVDPDKSFVNRKLTSQNANGALFQSETIELNWIEFIQQQSYIQSINHIHNAISEHCSLHV